MNKPCIVFDDSKSPTACLAECSCGMCDFCFWACGSECDCGYCQDKIINGCYDKSLNYELKNGVLVCVGHKLQRLILGIV